MSVNYINIKDIVLLPFNLSALVILVVLATVYIIYWLHCLMVIRFIPKLNFVIVS